jgi:hypothetical protein
MDRNQYRRPSRRATSPMLAALEDRRLMTGGLNPAATAASMALQANAGDVTILPAHDATPRTLPAHAGEFTTLPAYDAISAKDWIPIGSDAQFGPEGLYVLSGGNAWPTPSTPGGAAADPSTPQGRLDAAFAKQSADIQAVQDKSDVTPRLLAGLRSAREKAASEAGTPDAAVLKTFQDGVEAVRASGTFTDAQQAQLRADFAATLKSAGVSDGTVAELFAAQDAVRAASNVTADDLKTLADNQAAVRTLLDAMPRDVVAYDGNIAASSRGANAVTTYAPTMATTTAVATPGTKGAGPGIGRLPQGVPTPVREPVIMQSHGTSIASRSSGFDPEVQLARLSARMTDSTPVRVRNVAENAGANARRFVLNARAVPTTLARRALNFQGMRMSPTAARP